MTENEVALRLDGLTKLYGSVVALDHVDLEVGRGEFVTLLGPSGSGKSTTLLLIAGFEYPTTGDIFLEGRSLAGVPPHKRRIGMVFQNYALFPHLTVFENIAFALRNLKWRDQEVRARVEELLSLVQLEGLGARLPAQLSGGQQQRVALARALAVRPSILLLDEPLGALDKKLREQMLLEFRRIHRILGTTMIYVTHDQEEALIMSDRVAIMDRGRVVRIGTARDLYEDPRHPFVADFLGEANVLTGIARESDKIVIADGSIVTVSHNRREGAPVRVAVRPERMEMGIAQPGWNWTAGVVEEVVYVGESTKYRVRTPTGDLLSVKQINKQHVATYERGAKVKVAWHPSDGRVLHDA